ncbi:MAG: hypothetical protein ACREGD_01840 [Candidatus Saccharimonadales bacterium]
MARATGTKTNQTATGFFKRRAVRALVGVLAIGFAYLFFNQAIDSGNLLSYLMIGVFAFIALREFYGAVRLRSRSND